MKKFIKHGVIIIVLTVIADISVGIVGDALVRKLPESGDNLLTKPAYALQKASPDILILGSSRAEHHYDTRILQDSFPNLTIYNAGQHNQGMNYALAVLKSCSKRKKPQIVILDCEPETLEDPINNSNNTLKVFYNHNDNVKSVMNTALRHKIVNKSNFYKYNGVIIKLFLDSELPNRRDTLSGFDPLSGKLDTAVTKYHFEDRTSLFEGAETNLLAIISLCKQYDIKLYACVSPYYYHQNEKDISYMTVKKICSLYRIPFSDYMNDEYFDSHAELFRDVNHLNESGAQIFTKKFVSLLKNK